MFNRITYLIIFVVLGVFVRGADHPGLFLTPDGVAQIKASVGKYADFDKSVAELKRMADQALVNPIEVPVPRDGGGGYTHEKHKNNYYEMNAAGTLYQLTGDIKYAAFVRDMLLKYATLFPTLKQHPAARSETPGRLFWQALNDAVWLVHTANAYDCVYNYMTPADRQLIEKNLFYPMAEFISNGTPNNYETFNKMHNHGTWATAAVGMIGYVMADQNLVDKALYGSRKDGTSGFIRQLDQMFSPDGYFTEGPYYQRYSIWPFMTFAQVIENHQPELKIFKYGDGILLKAVNASLQCAYNGEFFYLNDALKKTYQTQELVYAVDIAYKNNSQNNRLLDIARQQGAFFVSDAGLKTAKAIAENLVQPYVLTSLLLRDGAKGDEGGVAVFRSGKSSQQSCLIVKATGHGLSHGHYDKLSMVFYDNGNCILPDYGAVRFLNVESKNGGNYTKENYSWAMQSIAHNTVTIDQKSHFDANIKKSSQYHSEIQYCNYSDSSFQIVSTIDKNAYKGVVMQRTSALVSRKDFEYPIVLDVFRVVSDSVHQLDFPFYYKGQMVNCNFQYKKNITEQKALGTANGYQHLWLESEAVTTKPTASFTWVNDNRFYTITSIVDATTKLMMTRTGAGDVNFNLRSEPCFMLRQSAVASHTFVSVIEPHGLYDVSREITVRPESAIQEICQVPNDQQFVVVKIRMKSGKNYLFVVVQNPESENVDRVVVVDNKKIPFKGNYLFTEIL